MKKTWILMMIIMVGGFLNAQLEKKINFSIYTGYSAGFTDDFDNNKGLPFKFQGQDYVAIWKDQPEWLLGAYLQWNLSQKFSLQLDINYQMVFPLIGRQQGNSDPALERDVRNHIVTFLLNGIYSFSRNGRTQVFIKTGAGPAFRNVYYLQSSAKDGGDSKFYLMDWHYAYLHLKFGPGMRIYLGEPNRSASLILGATVNYLKRWPAPLEDKYARRGGFFMQFYIGIEE